MEDKRLQSLDSFHAVEMFEWQVAHFFGAPYAVAVDSCTHGIELCLRHTKPEGIYVPTRTYISVAFLAEKLNIWRQWSEEEWHN